MWILFRLVLIFIGFFYRFRGLLLRIQFTSVANGLEICVKNKKQKDGSIATDLFLKVERNIFFRLAQESRWTKLVKKLGLGSEIQVGDPSFDEAFYIASDHPGFTGALATESSLRETLLHLKSLGFFEIRSERRGIIHMERVGTPLPDDQQAPLLTHLEKLKSAYDNIQLSLSSLDRRLGPIILLECLTTAICAYGVGSYFQLDIDRTISLLDFSFFLKSGLIIGASVFVLWLICVRLFFSGSSWATLLVTDFFWGLLIALLFGGVQALVDMNKVLDTSPTQITKALILKKYFQTTGSGKNRTTRNYLRLEFKENPYKIPSTVQVNSGDYYSMVEKQGVEFRIREGYFHEPYIQELVSIPAPWEAQRPSQSRSQPQPQAQSTASVPMAQLKDLVAWKTSLPQFETHSGPWAEVKYPSGAFRQREPLVNGVKNGLARYWHENGVLYGEIPWVNDQKHGCFKLFRSDGSLDQVLSYRDGKPHGFFGWYDSSGKLFARDLYQDGVRLNISQAELVELYPSRGCP
ncbi:MAG: hypothetical protein KGQ59_05455 [Bdellovibrionales bacterium]|nr:hypothetical protein [Bdellovibrionales bacterium]